jgi:twitching motility protein PilT
MTMLMDAPVSERNMEYWLAQAIERDASDLHVLAGNPPTCRIHGRLQALRQEPLPTAEMKELIRGICPEEVAGRLGEMNDADFSLQRTIHDACRRFRVNVFRSRRRLGCSIRVIPEKIPTFEWAGFPRGVAVRLASFRNGLILFTGVTGSGKSTSMAMLIEMLNEAGGYRIITVEEPIEYVFAPRPDTIISQREVGIDVLSFADGLKYGLRQDPDVMLVGEIRDRETAQLALSASETGHLVLSTMHTRDAKGAITRLTDMFPRDVHDTIRTQLAMSLRAVVSQHLAPAAEEGQPRALALEVMFNNLPVTSAIRSGNIEAIGDAILGGKADGMIALDESLRQLVQIGRITPETGRLYANDPRRFG